MENEPIRIRVGGGEDSKTGDFLMLFCHFVMLFILADAEPSLRN